MPNPSLRRVLSRAEVEVGGIQLQVEAVMVVLSRGGARLCVRAVDRGSHFVGSTFGHLGTKGRSGIGRMGGAITSGSGGGHVASGSGQRIWKTYGMYSVLAESQ